MNYEKTTAKSIIYAIRKKYRMSKNEMARFAKIPAHWYGAWEDGFESREYDRRAQIIIHTYPIQFNDITVKIDMLVHKLSRAIVCEELNLRKRQLYYYRKKAEKLTEDQIETIHGMFQAEFDDITNWR